MLIIFFVDHFLGTCPVERTSIQVFNNIISNDLDNEMEVEFSSNQYILPRKSCFFMVQSGFFHHMKLHSVS